MAVRLGRGLPLQIDLRGVLDRHHAVVLHDDVRRVGVLHRAAVHVGIAVQRAVHRLRPERERVDDLAGIELLARAGDPSRLIEVGQSVGHHLGVDAQVLHAAFEQDGAHGVGHGADAHLQAVAVLDLGGDEPTHRGVYVADGWIGQLRCGGVVALDDVVHLADVDAGLLAVDVRQILVGLDDDGLGALEDGVMPQVGGAQIEVAVLVHGARLEDDDVRRRHEAPVVVGNLTQVDRDVVAAPLVVLLSVVA